MTDHKKGVVLAISGIFVATITSILMKENSRTASPLIIALIQGYLGTFTTYLMLRKRINFTNVKLNFRKLIIPLFWAGGIGMGISNITRVTSLSLTSVAVATVIGSLSPLIVYILSLFILGSKIRYKMIPILIAASWSVVLIGTHSFVFIPKTFGRGELFALATVLTFSIGVIYTKKAMQFINPSEFTFVARVISVFFAIGAVYFYGDVYEVFRLNVHNWINFAAMSILGPLLLILINNAIDLIGPTLYSEISLIKNVFALVLGFLIFAEIPSTYQFLGAGILILSVYFGSKISVNGTKPSI